MTTHQDMTAIAAAHLQADIDQTLKSIIPGMAMKHGANPVEVNMAMLEALSNWLTCVSRQNTAPYLAALAWMMREKAQGDISDKAIAEFCRAVGAVRSDVQLLVVNAEGTA